MLKFEVRQMQTISPLVGISRIIDQYSTLIVGFDGVIYDGKNISYDAIKALAKARMEGRNVILLTNSGMRLEHIIKIMTDNDVPLNVFSLIMSVGEMIHYLLRAKKGKFANIGSKYYRIGNNTDIEVFADLGYKRVADINEAEFLYAGGANDVQDTVEKNREILEYAAALNLPMLCIGNDMHYHVNGVVCDGAGAFAEQYAMLGGTIITYGKPDIDILKYVLEGFSEDKSDDVLIVGDNLQTDIKMADIFHADSVLVSKGVHCNYLGENYIPDIQKAKELVSNYDVCPKYVISELRW